MSKTKKGSNAQFTGLQKGLTTIGKHVYAYNNASGNDTEFEVLNFTTGKNIYWLIGV